MKGLIYIVIVLVLISCFSEEETSVDVLKNHEVVYDTVIVSLDSASYLEIIDSNNIKLIERKFVNNELANEKWYYSNEVLKVERKFYFEMILSEWNYDSLGVLRALVGYSLKVDTLVDNRRVLRGSYFNKIKQYSDSGTLDRANSIAYMWLLKDTSKVVKVDEPFKVRLEYIDGLRDYDTIWFQTGGYTWPYFETMPNVDMQHYSFDENQVCELIIPTDKLGKQHYCSRIFAKNSDTTFTMDVVLDYEVVQ